MCFWHSLLIMSTLVSFLVPGAIVKTFPAFHISPWLFKYIKLRTDGSNSLKNVLYVLK